MHKLNFFGAVTVGAKGQVVIPVEARDKLGIQPGDKLFIIGVGPDCSMLGVCTEESVRGLMNNLTEKLETMRQAVSPDETTIKP